MKPPIPPPPLSYRLSHRLMGPVLNRFHLSCRHFSHLNLCALDRPLSAGERIRYRIHWIACSLCRKFERQMRSLAVLVGKQVEDLEQTPPDPEFIERVRREITATPRDAAPPES